MKNQWTVLKTVFKKIFGFKDGRVSGATIHCWLHLSADEKSLYGLDAIGKKDMH